MQPLIDSPETIVNVVTVSLFEKGQSPLDVVNSALAALEQGLVPLSPPSSRVAGAKNAILDAAVVQRLSGCRSYGMDQGALISALAYAKRLSDRGETVSAVEHKDPEDEAELGRRRLLEASRSAIDTGRILLAEGSTGIGKSHVIAKAAKHILESSKEARVLVLAPTMSVLGHLVDAYFSQTGSRRKHSAGIALGLGQLVDPVKALSKIERLAETDPEGAESAREWIESGGIPLERSAKMLCDRFGVKGWLVDDFVEFCGGRISKEEVLYRGGKGAVASVAAGAMEKAAESRIVFATQAMAAILLTKEIRRRGQRRESGEWEVLLEPPLEGITHVLCDEAHQLEGCFASALSSEIALSRIEKCLPATQSPYRRRKLKEMVSELSELLCEHGERPAALPEGPRERVLDLLARIGEKLAKEKFEGSENEQDRAALVEDLRNMANSHASSEVRAELSPVRKLPSVSVGPRSVGWLLKALWAGCSSACLYSATFFPTSGSRRNKSYSTEAAAIKLKAPRDRLVFAMAKCSWVNDSPTLFIPGVKSAAKLRYSREKEERELWLRAVAKRISVAAESAVGGTLVLCCSHEDVTAFSERLGKVIKNRILAQQRGRSVTLAKASFVEMSRAGLRPVWVATGPAWTGLDLRDETAERGEDDKLLTDLVITRIPVGVDRSSPSLARMQRSLEEERLDHYFYAAGKNAQMTLKQGLGRLVRREGLLDRRIWMLDGRPYFEGCGPFWRAFAKQLEEYEKVVDI